MRYRAAIVTVVETCSVLGAHCWYGGSLPHQEEHARGRRVRPVNRWRKWWADRNGDLAALHPPFPIGSPPKSPYHHPRPQPPAPRCEPLSAARPFRSWAADCWGRRALAVPRPASSGAMCLSRLPTPVGSVQAKPGCKTPCKRACGNAGGRRILRLLGICSCVAWGSSTGNELVADQAGHGCAAVKLSGYPDLAGSHHRSDRRRNRSRLRIGQCGGGHRLPCVGLGLGGCGEGVPLQEGPGVVVDLFDDPRVSGGVSLARRSRWK